MNLPDFSKLPPLSAEDAELLRSMESAQKRAIRSYCEQTEALLVERLEILLGRVPSDDEVRKHGFCGIHPDGTREYKWKGETFLKVLPIFSGITPPEHSS